MHPNEKVMRDADAAMTAGDIDGYWAAHTDDVVGHVAGHGPLAGTYKGKGEVLEVFDRFVALAGEFTFETHDYLASDDHGIAMQRSTYQRDDDRLVSNDVWICHFRDGKISEFWFIPEDAAANDAYFGSGA